MMLLATPWRIVESIPRTLQAFIGHRSIANTVIYTAVADTVLPPKADVRVTHRHVRHGPKAVIRKVQQHDGAKKVLSRWRDGANFCLCLFVSALRCVSTRPH